MKIYPILKKNKNKKKTKWIYKLRNYPITRSGITANPLEMYNSVGLTTVPNNTLVKHGNLDFVGGDTDTFEYDFFTKVVGSNLECSMKFYTGANPSLISTYPPTLLGDGWTGWQETTLQATIDKLKTQDGTNFTNSFISTGQQSLMMAEIDMSALATALGGNSALKSAFKNFYFDIWAKGSGANGGVLTNGAKVQIWNGLWRDWFNPNNTSNIADVTGLLTGNVYNPIIDSNNKIYILIHSQYASDGTIPSSVSLDYLKVTVQLNRVPDTVQAIPVNLPKYWACVMKGFSPNWDYNTSNIERMVTFYKDTLNQFSLFWDSANKKIGFAQFFNNVWSSACYVTVPSLLKYQVSNIYFGYTNGYIFLKVLLNNGTVLTTANISVSNILSGQISLYPLYNPYYTSQSANAFLDNVTLIDLEKIGKSAGYSDAEATAILNGTASGFENPELFDINKVTLHSNATLNNGVIILNATGNWQGSLVKIPVLPNNKYQISVGSNNLYFTIHELYNNIKIKNNSCLFYKVNGVQTITTMSNTNMLQLEITNDTIGTFSIGSISLKRKD